METQFSNHAKEHPCIFKLQVSNYVQGQGKIDLKEHNFKII